MSCHRHRRCCLLPLLLSLCPLLAYAATVDTDRDLLTDDREVILRTDPTKADTDGDGLIDGEEVELGSDPLNASSRANPAAVVTTYGVALASTFGVLNEQTPTSSPIQGIALASTFAVLNAAQPSTATQGIALASTFGVLNEQAPTTPPTQGIALASTFGVLNEQAPTASATQSIALASTFGVLNEQAPTTPPTQGIALASTFALLNESLPSTAGITVAALKSFSIYNGETGFFWELPTYDLLHGTETIGWYAIRTREMPAVLANAFVEVAGRRVEIGSATTGDRGQVSWDTTTVPDGSYQLGVEFHDGANEVGRLHRFVGVNNSPEAVQWHAGGTLAASEEWGPGPVHIVTGRLTIAPGATLTVLPGAVVKFFHDASLTASAGGSLVAPGADSLPVIFTPLEDDTAGGDTNMDGNLSRPSFGTYQVGGAGTIQFNEWTELRYLTATHSGTLASNQIWMGNTIHYVTGNLTIPNGVTLRILPGAIVKIDNRLSITVAAGGTLLAHGGVAQPIVVTSVRDDAFGGDTNGDGAATTPAPGDWKEIRNNGGTVSLSHTRMYYGGWAQFSNQGDGMIRNASSGSLMIDSCELAGSLLRIVAVDSGAVTIQNSILRDGRWGVTGNASVVNCVVYGCETGLSGSGTAVNSSITHCHGTMISGFAVQYCNLWNPPGVGQQTFPQTGTNGNISINPQYTGLGGGFFRPRFGSPLIDAADGSRAPEFDAVGAPRFDDPHMENTGVATANGAFADIGAYEVATGAQAEFDLVVRSVTGPANAGIGDTVRVEWDTANTTGTRTAQGPWRDAVALRSDDPTLGDQEIPLGDVLAQASLRPGDVQTFSATFTVPPLAEGRWRFQVTTNARRDLFEGLAANNNTSQSGLPVQVTTPEVNLEAGGEVTGSTGTEAGDRLFKFLQPAARDLIVRGEFFPANALGRLYAGLGRTPSRTSYDLVSPTADSSSGLTTLLVAAPTSDRWVYVIVSADGAPEASYAVTIEDATLLLTSIAVAQAGSGGTVTIPMTGSGFAEGMFASLAPSGVGTELFAETVTVNSSTQASVVFNLQGAAPGTYDVALDLDGRTAELPGAFTITAQAIGPRLVARIQMPDTVRAGRQYTAWFEYGNDGDADLPAPYFKLTSPQNMLMRLAGKDPWRRGTFEVLGISETQPVSVLKPGETRRIPVFFQTPTTGGAVQINFDWLIVGSDPMNWNEIGANIRPGDLSDETWAIVLGRLQSRIGVTWGDFLTRMRRNADYFGRFGRQTWTIDDLWQFEIRRAFGSHAVPGTLAGGTDAYRSGRGLGIGFSRWYPATFTTRAEIGILGYGWQHSLDYRLERPDSDTVKIHYPGGSVRSFFKDSGVWTSEAEDSAGLVQTSGGFELRERSGLKWTFDAQGLLASMTDSSGRHQMTLSYSGDRLTRVQHSDGQAITFGYTGNRLTAVTDDQGHTTTLGYDPSGNYLREVTTYDGRTTRYDYEDAPGTARHGALTLVTSPDGSITDYAYDTQGVVSSVSGNGGALRTDIAYGEFGEITLMNLEMATVTTHTGPLGETLVALDPLGRRVEYTYDPATLVTTGLRLPGGETVALGYNSELEMVNSTDPAGHPTQFAYTPEFGSLESFTDARGNRVRYDYNATDDLTAIEYPGGLRESWAVGSEGDAEAWTNRRNQTIAYEYDDEGRLTKATWPNGRTFTYVFDAQGLLRTASDTETGAITFTYNDREYLTRIDYPGGKWLAYEYDTAGRRTRLTGPDGYDVRYTYDLLGRLETLRDAADAEIVRYVYDEVGRLERQDRGNGTAAVYAYDLAGQLSSITHYGPSAEVQETIAYTYDVNGRRDSMTNSRGTTSYQYDLTGQLIGATSSADGDIAYEYDPVGNRIAVTEDGTRTGYETNALNQYLSAGDATFTHDDDGNLATRTEGANSTRYEYDSLNRLVRILEDEAETWSCRYNALGSRQSVTTGGVTTTYVVDPFGLGDVVAEYSGASLNRRYIHGGALVADEAGAGTRRYYSLNALTSTVALTNGAGNVVGQLAYDPFGNVANATGETTPFQYVGGLGVMEDGTGLLYMRNRYYSAEEGRFVQVDPIGFAAGDVSFYRYCGNNSISQLDPVGLCAEWSIAEAKRFEAGIELLDILLESSDWTFRVLDPANATLPTGMINDLYTEAIKGRLRQAARFVSQVGITRNFNSRDPRSVLGPLGIAIYTAASLGGDEMHRHPAIQAHIANKYWTSSQNQ